MFSGISDLQSGFRKYFQFFANIFLTFLNILKKNYLCMYKYVDIYFPKFSKKFRNSENFSIRNWFSNSQIFEIGINFSIKKKWEPGFQIRKFSVHLTI